MNENETMEIFIGDIFNKKRAKRKKRVIVFDFDETLGSFSDIDILWNILIELCPNNNINFNIVMDIYPEFIRYGIIYILEYLYSKKKSKEFHKLFIYTNNQSNNGLIEQILGYFHYKLSIPDNDMLLFDQVVHAFKKNNIRYEICRTSNRKTYTDLINCTMIPKDVTVCFIDDAYHPDMVHDRIYYIRPNSYKHGLSSIDIIHRFITSSIGSEYISNYKINVKKLNDRYISTCKRSNIYNNVSTITYNTKITDIQIARKLMFHIKEFFLLSNYKNHTTRKKRKKLKYQNTIKKRT